LGSRPSRRGINVVALDSGAGLSNATLQQRLVSVRLFYDFLVEEGVDDGQTAIDALLTRLTDIPTPAGPTPRELRRPSTATMLPIVEFRQGRSTPTRSTRL
jgi:site-specific recombinase XerC